MKVSELIAVLREFDPDLQVEVKALDPATVDTTMDAKITGVHLCRDLLKSENFARIITR